jgi:hypothetical protein
MQRSALHSRRRSTGAHSRRYPSEVERVSLLIPRVSTSPIGSSLWNCVSGPHYLPSIRSVEIGGLMTYAVELVSQGRRPATQVDEILRGANPGEIPFSLVTKYEFIMNLKMAKTLGLTVPPALLARADEVIE